MTQSYNKILLGVHTYTDKYLSEEIAETHLKVLFDKVYLGISFDAWFSTCRTEHNLTNKTRSLISPYYGIVVDRTLDFDPDTGIFTVTFNVYKLENWYQSLTTKKIEDDIQLLNTTSYIGAIARTMYENCKN